ncbi:MAG: hypothetical protein AAFZ92_11090 [Pseudomonadota bacterium]
MQRYTILFLLWAFVGTAVAQSFPDDLYATPMGSDLPDHQWSFKQGHDFDVINFKNSKGNGVQIYMGVNESTAIKTDNYLNAVVMGKPARLYEKCDPIDSCMYSTMVKAGSLVNGNDLWTQIWINPEDKGDMNIYINWLAKLKFETRS